MSLSETIVRRVKHEVVERLPLRTIETRLAERRGFLGLGYHSLSPDLDDYYWRTKAEAFTAHLDFLQEIFDIVPSAEAVAMLLSGEIRSRPRPVVSLYFDDGYRDNVTMVTPILERTGLSATLFAARDLVQRDGLTHMNEAELRQLSEHPLWSIAAHGLTHNVMTGYRQEERVAELRDSIKWIGDLTGVPPAAYAYPQGNVSPAVVALTRQYFDVAFTTNTRTGPGFDPVQIRRFSPTQSEDPVDSFARALFLLPLEDGIA